jgi:hypothetical protein
MPTIPDVLDDRVLSQVSQRGLDLYRDRLKGVVEPEHNGRTIAIHPDSGDYAIAANSPDARRVLRVRQPNGPIVTMLVGPNQLDQLARRMLGAQFVAGQPK